METRRMRRDSKVVRGLPDPVREKVGLPIGREGAYYVGDEEKVGVLDSNLPPSKQPGLWCLWEVSEDGKKLVCEDDKFKNYYHWLKYLIKYFFARWG